MSTAAVIRRSLSMMRRVHLFTREAEATLASGVPGERLIELFAIEVGPEYRREIKLSVRQQPQKEIADALIAAGANEKIRRGRIGKTEKAAERLRCHRLRFQFTGSHAARDFGAGLADVPLPAVVGGDGERERRVVACQRFRSCDGIDDL